MFLLPTPHFQLVLRGANELYPLNMDELGIICLCRNKQPLMAQTQKDGLALTNRIKEVLTCRAPIGPGDKFIAPI